MTGTNTTPVQMRLTGHSNPFSLTPAAHDELLRYLEQARDRLAGDPDGDESVRDLESAIGDTLTSIGEEAVSADRMRSMLGEMGTIAGEPSTPSPTESGPAAPRWCRVGDGKWIAGVCAGVAAATRASVTWVRIAIVAIMIVATVLLLPFGHYVVLVFLAAYVLAYLVAAVVLPPAVDIGRNAAITGAQTPR